MTAHEHLQETNRNPFDHTVHVGFRSHTLTGWTAGANNWDDNRRQKDHLNVVKDNGIHAPRPRTAAYADTMIRMGDAIDADGAITPQEKDKRLQDMLKTFLFDHARILVTNDGKALKTGYKAHLIGDVMDWYKDVIIRRHAPAHGALVGPHAWLNRPAVQPESGGWGLRAWLLGQAAMAFGAQFNHSAIGQSPIGTLARIPYNVGKAVVNSPIGTAASAIVNAPGISHAISMGGSVLNSTANVVGTTARYGEMLLQDTASITHSVVSGAWNFAKGIFS
jgi:hypothetical protein